MPCPIGECPLCVCVCLCAGVSVCSCVYMCAGVCVCMYSVHTYMYLYVKVRGQSLGAGSLVLLYGTRGLNSDE